MASHLQIPKDFAAFSKCYLCGSSIRIDPIYDDVFCDNFPVEHNWATTTDYVVCYRRYIKLHRTLSLYFTLTALAWCIYGLLSSSLPCAMVGLAFALAAIITINRLPSQEF